MHSPGMLNRHTVSEHRVCRKHLSETTFALCTGLVYSKDILYLNIGFVEVTFFRPPSHCVQAWCAPWHAVSEHRVCRIFVWDLLRIMHSPGMLYRQAVSEHRVCRNCLSALSAGLVYSMGMLYLNIWLVEITFLRPPSHYAQAWYTLWACCIWT